MNNTKKMMILLVLTSIATNMQAPLQNSSAKKTTPSTSETATNTLIDQQKIEAFLKPAKDNPTDSNGMTLLHSADLHNYPHIAEMLIKSGELILKLR
jgi:ankyrin repeat protein